MPHVYRFLITVVVVLQGCCFAANRSDAFSGSVNSRDTTSNKDPSPCDSSVKVCDMDRMVVTSCRLLQPPAPTVQPSNIFSSEEVTSAAGVAGDICRFIATLPSTVSALGENFDNALYVRGGRPSEVIFVVDGIEFENINHFSQANGSGGPVGFVNSDFVKQVDFFAGNAPVHYPSRLSSVIAIDLKNGSFDKRRHSLGCKLTGGMLSTEGPLFGGNGSYVLSGRYIDFSSLKRFLNDRGVPRIGDLYFKGVHLNDAWGDLSLSGLLSCNSFNVHFPVSEAENGTARLHKNILEASQRIVQGGGGLTYKLKRATVSHRADLSMSFRNGAADDSLHQFSDTFFVSRYAANPVREDRDTRLRTTLTTKSEKSFDESRILTFGIRGNFQRYGFFTTTNERYKGQYAVCSDTGAVLVEGVETPRRREMRFDCTEASGFAELTSGESWIKRSIGLRADYYQLLRAVALSPRLALTVQKEGAGSLLLTGGIGHQFPTEMPSLFFYFFSWFPEISDDSAVVWARSFLEQLEPLRCYQAAASFERPIAAWMMAKTGVYFKWYDREYNYLSPQVQDVLYVNSDHQWALHPQDGRRRAYGVELELNGPKQGGFNYTVGASLFDVKNKYDDGAWYDDWTNVRYTVSVALSLRLLNCHHLSLGAQGHGGRPYCPEYIVEDCIGRKSAIYQPGNHYYSQRLDPLVNTHVRYGFEKTFLRVSVELFVEVLNLFNSQPTLEYRFNGECLQEVKPFGMLPVIGGTVRW